MQVGRRLTSLLDFCPGHELLRNMQQLSALFHADPQDKLLCSRMWVVGGKKFTNRPPRSAFEDHEDEDAGIVPD